MQKRVTLINGQGKSLTKDSKELRVNYAGIWRKNFPIKANGKLKFLRQEVVYPFQRNFKEASGANRVRTSWEVGGVTEWVNGWVVQDFIAHHKDLYFTLRQETPGKLEEKKDVTIIEMILHVTLGRVWSLSAGIRLSGRTELIVPLYKWLYFPPLICLEHFWKYIFSPKSLSWPLLLQDYV